MLALFNRKMFFATASGFGRGSLLAGLTALLLTGCELEPLDCTRAAPTGGLVSITAPYNWADLENDTTEGTVFLAVQTPSSWTAGAAQFNATTNDGVTPNSGPVSPATQNPTAPPSPDNNACFQDPAPPGFDTTFYTIGPLAPLSGGDTGDLTALFTVGIGSTGQVPVNVAIAFLGDAFQGPDLQCGNIEQCTVTIAPDVPATIPALDRVGLILLILGLGAVLLGARLRKS